MTNIWFFLVIAISYAYTHVGMNVARGGQSHILSAMQMCFKNPIDHHSHKLSICDNADSQNYKKYNNNKMCSL